MPTAPPKRVLCVDDDEDTCNMLEMFLTHAGYQTVSTGSIEECLRLVEKKEFDLYLLDLWFKEAEEFELCHRVREIDSTTPIIIYSADARLNTRQQLENLNIQAFLIKPQGLDKLLETVARLINSKNAEFQF